MDKKNLYIQAKESYYEGNPIMSDLEFDELERELGLENKSYIGSVGNASYTVDHPVLMGSLSKIQIKKNNGDNVNYAPYVRELKSYLDKSPKALQYQVTPKFDGSSIEVILNYNGEIVSVSTRGNGKKGKDISIWYKQSYKTNRDNLRLMCSRILKEGDLLIMRGECLIKLLTFNTKYKDSFANPRAWVAGCIGQKWEGTQEQEEYRNDLKFVFYTFIKYDGKKYYEIDLDEVTDGGSLSFDDYEIGSFKEVIHDRDGLMDPDQFGELYRFFTEVRKASPYALDGFVIKPMAKWRLNNFNRERPEESVAIKFLPEILVTEIKDISWKLAKTGEWYPKAILKPVMLDGKKISKASLHNYNYLITNKCGIGSTVEISLAGDIIPFVYKVIKPGREYVANTDIVEYYNIPENNQVVSDSESGIKHLMVYEMTEREQARQKFIASAKTLNLTNIGEKTAAKIWDALTPEDLNELTSPMFNVCQLFDDWSKKKIVETLGDGKSVQNILKSLENAKNNMTLAQLIDSCNFSECGTRASEKVAEAIYNMKTNVPVDSDHFKGLSSDGWNWLYDKNSKQWQILSNLAVFFTQTDKNIYDRVELNNKLNNNSEELIPVILTGAPEGMTKKQWLDAHPMYKETSKWNECKILFCSDLNSSSSKMSKAKSKGITIKLYNNG